ncbi:hypothetical protein [Streptomyces rubrogriseus]|uniref:hypothetical protein n=1 Tax=Streptomyces rubrogriseus TaxID=194673 RepID=UPI0037CEC6C4
MGARSTREAHYGGGPGYPREACTRRGRPGTRSTADADPADADRATPGTTDAGVVGAGATGAGLVGAGAA